MVSISKMRRGFTLVEVLVVVTLMALLIGVVLASLGISSKKGRDAQRQADLTNLKVAIEQYRARYGRYPDAGCSQSPLYWQNESLCPSDYITGATIGGLVKPFVPDFLPTLPHDPARNGNEGYSYIVNAEGTVYKLMAMNTVESEVVGYSHPLKSCDVIPRSWDGSYPNWTRGVDINTIGICSNVDWRSISHPWAGSFDEGQLDWCKSTDLGGGGRFDKSYAVWAGFSNSYSPTSNTVLKDVANMTSIICR